QAVADVVLREQHVFDAPERVRLLVPKPQDLRRLEPGERRVARDLDEPALAHQLGDDLALLRGPLVVPEQCRPDHVARRVQEHRPVHLAGEADAGDVLTVLGDLARRRPEHLPNAVPPSRGILLGPLRAGREQRVLGRRGGDDGTLLVDGDRLGARGADVDADRARHRVEAAFTFRAWATEPRSSSSVRNTIVLGGCSPSSRRRRSMSSAAPRAMSATGCRTVVTDGLTIPIHWTSSNAASDMS